MENEKYAFRCFLLRLGFIGEKYKVERKILLENLRKLKKYKPTKFKAKDSVYNKELADYAVSFIECLCHTKGTWVSKPFELIDW